MAEGSGPIVGIDLGTTNSSIGVHRGGAVELLPNALGDLLTPSVVALDQRQHALVAGKTAKDIYLLHPDRGAALFKRDMGTDRRRRIGRRSLSAVELSALLLRSLKRDAETALGEKVDRAVITVPAYFDEAQRFATLKAGELADLDVVRILNEPTAAAIAHGVHTQTSDGMLMVLDLGGGTFDVCLMERFGGVLEARSVAGDSQLGGEDFTRALAYLAMKKVGVVGEHAEAGDQKSYNALLRRSEILKRSLSAAEGGTITMPRFKDARVEGTEVEITLADAEEAWAHLLDRTLGPIRRAFSDAGLSRRDVDGLLLVGGATRLRCFRKLVAELFPAEPISGVDPDLTVTIGAATQGALHMDHAAVGDFVVTDVISHSLGLEIGKDLDGQIVEGFFSPLIHRNTVIPTSRAGIYHPLDPRSAEVRLEVYEGEARYTRDNRRVGMVRVPGIPRTPGQRDVEVRFTYDLNGILEVEATVVATGRKVTRVFSRDGRALSRKEIRAAAERMGKIKEDPRTSPFVGDLLARAEALLMEVPPHVRAALDLALDALEAAIESRNEARIREECRQLIQLCEDIDGGERW